MITVITLITMLEGFSATPYPDAHGYSIGYGHFIQKDENYSYVSKEFAMELLKQDLKPCLDFIDTLNVSHNQRTALGSFCYNVGLSATKNSTLVRLIKEKKDTNIIADEFDKWIYSQGKVLNSLKERRLKEKEVFLGQCLTK